MTETQAVPKPDDLEGVAERLFWWETPQQASSDRHRFVAQVMALGTVPEPFILYGGTGLALRLGHRTSVDFDFFCFEFFEVEALRRSARWSVYQRAEAKDYLDVHALLKAGLSLADGLRFAKQVYGPDFTTMLPLQALCYFAEPPLRALSAEVRTALTAAVQSVK